MADPAYSQSEADQMLNARKRAAYESLAYAITGRVDPGYVAAEFTAAAEDESLGFTYKVITHRNNEIGAYSVTLEGAMAMRKMQAICRYEIQPTRHTEDNCRHCRPPVLIAPGIAHIHRYNYLAEKDGFGWWKCATIMKGVPDPSRVSFRTLLGEFIKGMRIKFSDTETVNRLFEGAK